MSKRQKCKNGVWLQARPDMATWIFFSPPCKLKSCVTCSRLMRLRHIHRIMYAVHTHESLTWYFLTITMPSKYHKDVPTDGNLPILRKMWSKLRKRLSRRYNGILWVRVYERHKSGVYHAHIIMGVCGKVGQRWIKAQLHGVGLGYQYKLVALDHNMVSYVAKYATKADLPIRAVEYSRNFPRHDDGASENVLKWEYLGNVSIDHWVQFLRSVGADVTVLTDDDINEDDINE